MTGLSVRNISYRLPGEKKSYLFKDFSLSVGTGEHTGIYGPNGCGKTTLFHLISGILKPLSGTIRINGKDPSRAEIAYIFQDYRSSLFPWYTVRDNILFPLKIRGLGKRHMEERFEYIETLSNRVLDFSKYPYQLSGGQQQFTAILRGLIMDPSVILFDEPFTALDRGNTDWLMDEISRLSESVLKSVLVVSHDENHLYFLCDRILHVEGCPLRIADVKPTGNHIAGPAAAPGRLCGA